MKNNLLLNILMPSLLTFLFSATGYSQKITVLPSQVTAESGDEDGAKLFDEQTVAGDPKAGSGGACANTWIPGWTNLPHHAYVDLGQTYNITDIYLYDLNGASNFTVETGTPGSWTTLFVDGMSGWQAWNAHAVNVNTRYIRFTSVDGDCRAYEVVLYGSPGAGGPDNTAPADISNLACGVATASSIALAWTSPGDDGNTGTASVYDLRYSTSAIVTVTDFNNATQVSGEPTPKVAGGTENFTVTGLSASTAYYFAIRTSDEVPNTSGISNVPTATTTSVSSGGTLPPLTKTYIHIPSMDPQWNSTPVYNALEPADFDAHWAALLAALPAADGAWNGGNINLGTLGTGYGLVTWNGASSSAKKPILLQQPSAGAAPGIGICPMDNRFIVCSAMNNSTGTINNPIDYETAVLAIQQMLRNIIASGNSTNDVFIIAKSQGGGTGLMTAGLCANVKDFFLSVPALSGYTGTMGTTGAYPGYPSTTANGYIDAVNHAKRYRNKASFSISYDDNVTWGQGQVTDAKNTQFETTIYHGNDGHNDPDWWSNGTLWLNACLDSIVDNGVGLAGTATSSSSLLPDAATMHIYPNPFAEELIMIFSQELKGMLSLYSVYGTLIQQVQLDLAGNELRVNKTLDRLNQLMPGIYIIELSGTGGVTRSKVVKQ